MISFKGLLAVAVLTSSLVSVAQADIVNDKYLSFGKPEVQEVTQERALPTQLFALPQVSMAPVPMAAEGGPSLGDIINIGKEIWAIIEANRPVVNVTTDLASAVPRGTETWQSLTGWSVPQSKAYRVVYKNGFGMRVVDFTYQVFFTHSGNVKGAGRYLTNVTVVPTNLTVAWGYKMSAIATVPTVVNVGTEANPIAAMQMFVKWEVDTVLKHQRMTQTYNIQGDGAFEDLSAKP